MRPGETIKDTYELLDVLGTGGMGTVFRARHVVIDRPYALKCLHPHLAEKPEVVQRFVQEARAATKIGNEHIIEVTDAGTYTDGSLSHPANDSLLKGLSSLGW
jgi:serine/threonine-protein kinase